MDATSTPDREEGCAYCGVSLVERITVATPDGILCADCADPDDAGSVITDTE